MLPKISSRVFFRKLGRYLLVLHGFPRTVFNVFPGSIVFCSWGMLGRICSIVSRTFYWTSATQGAKFPSIESCRFMLPWDQLLFQSTQIEQTGCLHTCLGGFLGTFRKGHISTSPAHMFHSFRYGLTHLKADPRGFWTLQHTQRHSVRGQLGRIPECTMCPRTPTRSRAFD